MHRRHRGRSGHGLMWGTLVTLGPYAVVLLGLLAWAWPHDTLPPGVCSGIGFGCTLAPRDAVLFFAAVSAPFAAIATGVTWLVVLLLQLSPVGRRWRSPTQGGVGSVLVLAIAGVVAAIQLL